MLCGVGDVTDSAREQDRWRGERLGMPETGPGSAAPMWRRAAAFFLDLVLAALVAALFTFPELPRNWSMLAWTVITVLPVAIAGTTPGMAITRIWVARMDARPMVGVWRALVRCALTTVIIPPLVQNSDGRGWHDQLTGTIVLRR